MIAVFFFIFNPQGLVFDYGWGGGRYEDRVDSFSDYLIRNTVKRNILSTTDKSFLPIMNEGFSTANYEYTDKYIKYRSNAAIQTVPITLGARLLRIRTEEGLDKYFVFVRAVNALLFSAFLVGFLYRFCLAEGIRQHFLIPLLVGASSGFVFFAQNLYFVPFLIVVPAFFIAARGGIRTWTTAALIMVLGMFYFLRGYEFATVLALLTAFAAALFADGSLARKVKHGVIGFALICLAFAVALVVQAILVSFDSGWTVPMHDSLSTILGVAKHRAGSVNGVPIPFSAKFFTVINERWGSSAFSVPIIGSLTEKHIILAMLIAAAARYGRMASNEALVFAFGFIGYFSWYIFAYQHIMWHPMYDWYLFSLTFGIAASMLSLIYVSRLTELFARKRRIPEHAG